LPIAQSGSLGRPVSAPGQAGAAGAEAVLTSAPPSLPREITPGREELQLRIDSRAQVWLSITADGVRQWQGIMRPNQTREVQATESVLLTVGDAAAVSLTLNGRSLPGLGPGLGRSGEVKHLTITARDASESAP
jgi:hypothetical protein